MSEETRWSAHNQEVAELWEAFGRGENPRVPIVFAADEALWLSLSGHTFREFYTNPRAHLETWLVGARWWCHSIVHDRPMGPPEAWTVVPRWWMDEPEVLGCPVRIQENQFAWAEPLDCPKPELLARLRDLDPVEAVRESRLWHLYQDLLELTRDMQWRDRPVNVVMPGGGTHGIFTIACHVRGPEQLCMDLLEDPDFADSFLMLIAEKLVGRMAAWHRLADTGTTLPAEGGWGMADDSLQLLSEGTYRARVLPVHRWVFDQMTTGPRHVHLCGYAQQHFRALYEDLGVRTLDGPGPFVDLGRLLGDFPELTVNAQADHTVLLTGPVPAIEAMMRDMLTPAARQPGRIHIMGFAVPRTPMHHIAAMVQAGKRFGAIP